MTPSGRAQRVAELLREEIAKLLATGIKDPRVGFVSVMGVTMSPDLRYANVYVSLYGEPKEQKSSLIALRNASGWIRRELRPHLRLKFLPEIRFFQDDSLEQVYQLEEVFETIHEQKKAAPMIHLSLPEIIEELRRGEAFLITAHENPDGDAVGSVLALQSLLKALGKTQTVCALPGKPPRIYRNLPGADAILRPDADELPFEPDTVVVLDVSRTERLGAVADWIDERCRVVVIDHHLEEDPMGDVGFIDASYAATGEIVVELFAAAEIEMPRDAAHCAYVAQVTDTGVYRFSNTSPRSHRIAAALLETGIDGAAIASDVFEMISRPKLELLRIVLDRLSFAADDRVAHSYLTQADLEACKARREDVDGLVNYPRNVEGVEVGVLFYESDPGKTKVSLRSRKHFNSAAFLAEFGGGGHAPAAGASLEMTIDEAREAVMSKLVPAVEAAS